MTPQGQQASDISDWAFADPSRRDEALDKIRALARAADSDQALREIQDAGTMVSRLTPPARTMPSETISGQLAGQ